MSSWQGRQAASPGALFIVPSLLSVARNLRSAQLPAPESRPYVLPEGVKLAGNPMETIANVVSGRLSRMAAAEVAPDQAGEAPAEGGEAAAAEEAPAG